MKYGILFILLMGMIMSANAQQTPEEFILQVEHQKRARLMQVLDSGVYLMEQEQYVEADEKFKHVLSNIKAVPSDLTFYFGKNSYFLKQYKQSIDWLNKYIQLKGTIGQYSDEAVTYMKKSEGELLKIQIVEREKAAEVLSSDYEIDCGPSGKVICPVCAGEHVIIKRGAFGNEYKTCPFCDDHGILTCEEYNLLVKGDLKPKF